MEATTTTQTNDPLRYLLAGAGLMLAGVVAGAGLAFSALRGQVGQGGAPANVATEAAQLAAPQALQLADPARAETLAGARSGMRIGRADAPVQIVSFEDPLCGYCKQLQTGPFKALVEDFVTQGKVAINYRHYPFLASESRTLAVALECAGEQGKFEHLHQELVAQTGTVALDTWPARAGADAARFNACLSNPAAAATVDADLALGRKFRVTGTPTLFVNGERLIGLMPYEVLKSKVEQKLAG